VGNIVLCLEKDKIKVSLQVLPVRANAIDDCRGLGLYRDKIIEFKW